MFETIIITICYLMLGVGVGYLTNPKQLKIKYDWIALCSWCWPLVLIIAIIQKILRK